MSRPIRTMPVLALALISTVAFGQQEPEPINLAKYIQSLKWDADKSGPLIAIDPDNVWARNPGTNDLIGYQREIAKVGKLSVIVQNWGIEVDEDHLPNAYQQLSDDDKLTFLVATLSPSLLNQFAKTGLCADDLQGEQRAALLSMIPKKMQYMDGISQGNGFSTSKESIDFPEDQYHLIRLQLRKGVNVGYGARSTDGRGTGYSNLCSLTYRGVNVPVLQTTDYRGIMPGPTIPGTIVPRVEKKGDLTWGDARLSKPIELKSATIGQDVDEIRNLTGIEIYADARIQGLNVAAYGNSATAGELLRGITVAVEGTVPRVGSAIVLTSDMEGAWSRETRYLAHNTLGQMQIESEIHQWRNKVANMQLAQTLPFPQDDPLQASTIPSSAFTTGTDWNTGWVALTQLPGVIDSSIKAMDQDEIDRRKRYEQVVASQHLPNQHPLPPLHQGTPVQELEGKVRLSVMFGYRMILADGRPLEGHPWSIDEMPRPKPSPQPNEKPRVPVDPTTLAPESAIAIKSNDVSEVDKACALAKSHKLTEIWLDSQNKAAIQAANDSGLKVDLIVHPWDLMKGEQGVDPDRNIVGQSGSQLNEIPGANFDPLSKVSTPFVDTIAPTNSQLGEHWNREMNLISSPGIKKVIVVDQEPSGYERADQNGGPRLRGTTFVDGVPIEPGLQQRLPNFFEFGYSTSLREKFLRQNHIDPIDLGPLYRQKSGPPSPYFDQPLMFTRRGGLYPGVDFPRVRANLDRNLTTNWQTMRNDALEEKFANFLTLVKSKNQAVFLQQPVQPQFNFWSVKNPGPENEGRQISVTELAPGNMEDAQGTLTGNPFIANDGPVCIDLRQVPLNRLAKYLDYIFKVKESHS